MKKTTIETVPEHVVKNSEYFCDFCDKDLSVEASWGAGAKLSYHNSDEISKIDVCMKCMRDIIMPAVIKQFEVTPRDCK